MRIVSLACSNTEIVCALGCASMLVGVDDHSDFPSDVVRTLPKVGPDLDIDVERVSELSPDLVLATDTVPGHDRIIAKLEAARLPFIAPEPVSLEDVYSNVAEIAEHLGVPERGESVISRMRSQIHALPPLGDHPPSILVQWWPKPSIVPGRFSWISDLIELAGGRNPIGDEPVKSRPVPDEEVATIAPDHIVISWCGVAPEKYRPDVVYRNENWGHVPAIVNRSVHCIPEGWMGRPGPRLIDGFRALRAIVEGSTDISDPTAPDQGSSPAT